MFYFTGIQHTKSGDIAIPVVGYETEDEYEHRYHQEMIYAMDNADFLGITIIVFDNSGNNKLYKNWIRSVAPVTE